MSGRHLIVLIFLLMGTEPTLARGGSKGVSLSASVGLPSAQIDNPDGTKALYSGLSFFGRVNAPIFSGSSFSFDLVGSVRYMDFKNTANSGTQKEISQHIGPGIGFEIQAFRFLVGADYHFMLARHYSVGMISDSLEYKMTTLSYHGGLLLKFGAAGLAFLASQSQGSIPQSATGLGSNSPYSDTTYWIQFRYYFSDNAGELLESLFKR